MPTLIRCPSCNASLAWSVTEKFRPFCSERCRLIDLGGWASDRYVVGGTALPADGQAEPNSPRPDPDA